MQYFEYDAEHRLICVDQCKSLLRERVVFGYDPLGRRISKEIYQEEHPEPTRRTLFHWQGLRLLQEVQRGLSSVYVYASPGSYDPLSRIDGKPGQEDIQCYHTNLAGLPEQLTDAGGETLWRSDYHGWGSTRDEWHSQRQAREQNLRYQGQYLDREIGLHYNTFRFYDPEVGCFTTCDPIGLNGIINLYTCASNPTVWIDPLGLAPKAPLSLPDGYRARIDRFNLSGGASFEVHVYAPNGKEIGIYGPNGFFNKHGHHASAIQVPSSVSRTLNGIAVEELRKNGKLPIKGAPNGKKSIREHTNSIKNSGKSGCDL